MNAASAIGGLISEVFNGEKDILKDIYLDARKEGIENLEKEQYEQEWTKATRPFYEKCAAMVFDTIGRSAPELKERVIATLKDPEIIGYPDKTDFMYPSYTFLMAYYMYTGKKGKAYYANQIDKLCDSTINGWIEQWKKEI